MRGSEVKEKVKQYVANGEMSHENGVKALKLYQSAQAKGKNVSIDMIIAVANLKVSSVETNDPLISKPEEVVARSEVAVEARAVSQNAEALVAPLIDEIKRALEEQRELCSTMRGLIEEYKVLSKPVETTVSDNSAEEEERGIEELKAEVDAEIEEELEVELKTEEVEKNETEEGQKAEIGTEIEERLEVEPETEGAEKNETEEIIEPFGFLGDESTEKEEEKNHFNFNSTSQLSGEAMVQNSEGLYVNKIRESDKSKTVTGILFLLFFPFSVHRFYTDRPLSAVLQIITAGGLGIWWAVDFFQILLGSFKDGSGDKITKGNSIIVLLLFVLLLGGAWGAVLMFPDQINAVFPLK